MPTHCAAVNVTAGRWVPELLHANSNLEDAGSSIAHARLDEDCCLQLLFLQLLLLFPLLLLQSVLQLLPKHLHFLSEGHCRLLGWSGLGFLTAWLWRRVWWHSNFGGKRLCGSVLWVGYFVLPLSALSLFHFDLLFFCSIHFFWKARGCQVGGREKFPPCCRSHHLSAGLLPAHH